MTNKRIIFFGSVVPDRDEYISKAFSRAGNSAQIGFLTAISYSGYSILEVLTFQPRSTTETKNSLMVSGVCLPFAETRLRLLPYINFPVLKILNLLISFLVKGLLSALKHKPVAIVTYNFSLFHSIPAQIISRVLNIPYIPIIYDMDIPGETVPRSLYRKIDFAHSKSRLSACDGVIAISERIAKDFLDETPYLIIEGGIAEVKNLPQKIKKKEPLLIFFAGALEKYNGLDVMLAAVDLLKDGSYRFVVAGSGNLQDLVISAANKNPDIEFLGFVSGDVVSDYLQQADVLINHRSYNRISSPYVFPSKLIEYMASGVPTISTRFEGLPADYEQHLMLLDDETPEALARALTYVAEHADEVRGLGLGARQFIARHKTWRAHGRMLGAFFDNVIHRSRRGVRAS